MAAPEFKARGAPLAELWETVVRYVYSRPSYKRKSRANVARTRALCAGLPPHPTPMDVLPWYHALLGHFAPTSAYAHLKNLAAVYRYGSEYGVTQGNPAAVVLRDVEPPDPQPTPVVAIDAVWPRFMAACLDDRERAYLGVLRFAGLRRGEALGLMADDVNTYAEPWRVHVHRQRPEPNSDRTAPVKSKASNRHVPVRPELRPLLAAVLDLPAAIVRRGRGGGRREASPLLFPYQDDDLAEMGERLREAEPTAIPPGRMWHVFRDTLGVEMSRRGKSVAEVSAVLGHSTELVTRKHYLGSFGGAMRADIFEGMTARAAGPPRAGAPPGVVPGGARSGARPAATGPAPRGSKSQSNQRGQEATCSTPSRKQRALPGLSVGPVVRRPRR
jgi:integrase